VRLDPLAAPQLNAELGRSVLLPPAQAPAGAGWLELESKNCCSARPNRCRAAPAAGRPACALAVDDFGSAGASLADLQALATRHAEDRPCLRARLGNDDAAPTWSPPSSTWPARSAMRVVALGVDDSHQLEVLQSLGCDQCQGDLFSPPLQAAGAGTCCAAQPDGTTSHHHRSLPPKNED
jgi:hypothetical protein